MAVTTQYLEFRRIAGTTVARLWLVFSFLLVLGVATFSVLEGENPLSSDNPHIAGLLFACIAAGLAFVYSVADCVGALARWEHWIVATVLGGWCLALTLMDYLTEGGEGDGWGYFIAIGSFIAGGLGWVVCAFRLPIWVRITVSAMGFAVLFLYGYVVMRMSGTI